MKRIISLTLLISVATVAAERKAKNVVLFIADAAGMPVVSLAGIHAGKPQGLFIQRMPNIGLMDTSSASSWVTTTVCS